MPVKTSQKFKILIERDEDALDKIINEARLDYALGNYKGFTSAKDLIAGLHS